MKPGTILNQIETLKNLANAIEIHDLYEMYIAEKYNIHNPVRLENGEYFSMVVQDNFITFRDACILAINKKASN